MMMVFLWLAALMAYILAGTPLVPFHGDESTVIWMSRDYGHIFLERDMSQVRYSEPPVYPTGQHLRLLNGPLMRYVMGITWHGAGYDMDDINEQWDWGAGWEYNIANNHAPADDLLQLLRWPSALLLAGGVVIVFGIGRYTGGYPAAYLASLCYALNPALLLNGRRAMFEGGLLFFSLAAVAAAIWFLRERSWRSALALGAAGGLAICAKHPAALTVGVALGACGVYVLLRIPRSERLAGLARLAVAALIVPAIFYALNPVWWGDPIARVGQVLEARAALLNEQMRAYGHYDSLAEQLTGFARQALLVRPQYYEVAGWGEHIGDQIAAYQSSFWSGITPGRAGAIAVLLLLPAGLWALLRGPRETEPARWLVGVWAGAILAASAVLTPLEWQRYYLMAYPAIGLLAGLGLWALLSGGYQRLRHTRNAPISASRS
jgi:4-amino-4-deoxy-L-arabinose transferase-like glycosyltransferase